MAKPTAVSGQYDPHLDGGGCGDCASVGADFRFCPDTAEKETGR